eukprot:s3742_g3.t3
MCIPVLSNPQTDEQNLLNFPWSLASTQLAGMPFHDALAMSRRRSERNTSAARIAPSCLTTMGSARAGHHEPSPRTFCQLGCFFSTASQPLSSKSSGGSMEISESELVGNKLSQGDHSGAASGPAETGVSTGAGASASKGGDVTPKGAGASTSQGGDVTPRGAGAAQSQGPVETPPKISKPAAPSMWDHLDNALQGWDVMVSMQDNPVPQVENPQTPLRSRQGAASGDELGDQMRGWAKRAAENAIYLEFPDVFLLAHSKQLNFKFFVYCEGQIIAAYVHKTPALVLSVWRTYKKGTGSQLTWREISRGAVHSARVVLLRHKEHQTHDNAFVCDSMSECLVLGLEQLGVRLDSENMCQKKAIDGTKIQLGEDGMKALHHLVTQEQKKAEESKGVKIARGKRYIVPEIANFRRTKKGKALMQQELRLLLEFETKNFPTKPMLTPDHLSVRFSEQDTVNTVTLASLMDKVYEFFSAYFYDVRNNKQAFGVKVQGWLTDVKRAMQEDGSTAKLNSLVAQVNGFSSGVSATLADSQGEGDSD